MLKHKHTVILCAAVLLAVLFAVPASAQAITVDPTTEFCFSAEDFIDADSADGIFLTSMPRSSVATVSHGTRVLRSGDAIPINTLNQLKMNTHCITAQNTSIGYFTVKDGEVSAIKELKLSILPKKNEPPVTENGTLETYRNIANTGTLPVSDPENGPMTFDIVEQPKRGTVELHEDGAYTYTPNENKVGKDRFTFTATDDAGNTSEEGEIIIEIKKPTDKQTYADMADDKDAFNAMWLKEQGLFTGTKVGGNLCFEPEKTVSRGEFLVMAMGVVNAKADDSLMTTGFADEDDTPGWLQPYIVSALADGMISGTRGEDGIRFMPQADLTKAEAAVMLQNILQLPTSTSQAVGAFDQEGAIPAWASEAAAALSASGISLEVTVENESLTRRDAARVLYQVSRILETETTPTFYWVQ